MRIRPLFTLALALAALSLPARAGGQLPAVALEGFSQTPAKTFEEFRGRALLIEFFAFW